MQFLDKLIIEKFARKLALQCRAEMVTSEFLDKITLLNNSAEVVLELGLQTINKEEQKIIDRPNNMKIIEKILNEINARAIKHEISLIFGLPKQTVVSFKQSIDFCIRHKVPVIHAFLLMLLRGTPLYYRKNEFGLIESDEVVSEAIERVQTDIPHVVASNSFTYQEWQEMASMAKELELSNKKSYAYRL